MTTEELVQQTADHERIWLQPADNADVLGRLWCQDKVWPEEEGDAEPTEYVRADLYQKLQNERDALLMQAQSWAGEAKCHKSTVHEAYQIVTGAKGEPGNWHGAEPIKAALEAANARADAAEAKVGKIETGTAAAVPAAYAGDDCHQALSEILAIARAAVSSEALS